MITVNRFLCCRLRTAGVTFGWLGAIFSIFWLVLMSILIPMFNRDPKSTDDVDYKSWIPFFIIYLVISAISLIASLALIIGTIRERHLLLVPWLINRSISIGFSILVLIFLIEFIAKLPNTSGNKKSLSIPAFLVFISHIAFESWLWVVIYSLFKQIRNNRYEPLIPNSARGVRVLYPSYMEN